VKIKCAPEDFRVDEQTDLTPTKGNFAFYRLSKRGIGTLEAIDFVLQRWQLPRNTVSYGGLKDRHALTSQYLTIRGGPARSLEQPSWQIDFLGYVPGPYSSQQIKSNQFSVVIRQLTREELSDLQTAFEVAVRDGVPNYFDDQRFGSVGYSGEFIGKYWTLGNYERAFWLAMADPNPHDDATEKNEKQILRDNWGNWAECKAQLARSHRRSLISFLADRPADYRGALSRIRQDMRSLYLSAYQSALWNRMLAMWLTSNFRREQLTTMLLKLDAMPVFTSTDDAQRELLATTSLPLPSVRAKVPPGPIADVLNEVIKQEGMELRQMRIKHPKDSFFSRGDRRVVVKPESGSATSGPDDLYPKRQLLRLEFQLPRGAYATMLIKRLGVSEE